MNLITEKVIQRLVYEGLLFSNEIQGRKRPIKLEEVLMAGRDEPRTLEVLPALLLHRPTAIRDLKKSLKNHPEIDGFIRQMKLGKVTRTKFLGLEAADCLKHAQHFEHCLRETNNTRKSQVFNLRISPEEFAILQKLTRTLNQKGLSETVRYLIRETEQKLSSETT